MRAPALMLAAAVLFWGWQAEAWAVAVPVAAVLGAAPFVPLRWEFANAQLYRVADFCTVLMVLLSGYLFVTYGNPRAIVLVFQWLPVAMLPLALLHAYGTAREFDLAVLMWNLRRNPPRRPVRFDPTLPYLAIWLLAASAANMRDEWFYWAVAVLVAWPLAIARPHSFSLARWAVALACALTLGYGMQHGIRELQLWLEGAVPDWIAGTGSRTNPYRSMTDIGHIGELKQSDAIVLRVAREDGGQPPRLLHRASYNVYAAASWIARDTSFLVVRSGGRAGSWALAPEAPAPERIFVHDFSPQVNPVLSLPAGTTSVEQLQARRVTRNALGAVQIEREPGFFSYAAAFTPGHALEGPPTAEDVRLSRAEREYFAQLAVELRVSGLPAAEVVERARRYFRGNFRYATFQARLPGEQSPIVDFMRRTRAGHCEYFATATVLLLRAAGVPARYATGFAVQEYSRLEGAWLVRQRHAHAWALAYVDGTWFEVDTTPPEWFVVEAESAPAWSGASDLWSWFRFRAAQAWAQSENYLVPTAAVVMSPFALWLAWRLYRSRRIARPSASEARAAMNPWPGMDSELYLIERSLAAGGWGRRPRETVSDWARRVHAEAPFDASDLPAIAELHCRYRFDPEGLTETDRTKLKTAAAAWLARGIPAVH